jgi:hypothetical protein
MTTARRLLIVCTITASVGLFTAAPVFAAPTGPGQPSQSCEEQPASPGHASSAPGSAFKDGGVAGTKYAGEQPQNSLNPHSVSQYDVACFQVSQ